MTADQDKSGLGSEELVDLLELTRDLMHCVSPDGQLLWANRAWRETLGYAAREVPGLRIEDFVADESLPQCREIRQRLVKGQVSARLEAIFLTRNGSRVRVEGRVHGRWKGDECVAIPGVFRSLDVERRRQHDLRHFFDLSLDLLAIATVDGYFRVLNPAWKASLGYDLDELVGRPFLDFVYPADVAATVEALGALAEGKTVIGFENRYRHRDGSWRHFLWTAAPDPDPASDQVYAAARDVSDLRAAQAALEEREARQRALIEATVDGILSVDTRGRIGSANPAAARILGCQVRDLLDGQLSDFLVEPHRSQLDAVLASLRREEEQEVLGRIGQVVGLRADGAQVPLEWTLSGVPGAQDQPLMVTFRDISERLAVERMKSEFVSTVSHELRTPLTSIRGTLRLVEEGVVGVIPKEARDLVQVAHSNCLRLGKLIDDILDLEKLEVGQARIQKVSVELEALVVGVVDRLAGFAAEHGVRLERPSIEASDLRCDPESVEQVLANLLSNAVKFSPEGSEVRTRVEARGDQIRFEVRDQGPGVPPEERERIFGRFQQLDATDRRRRGGTGLGLAIAKALVLAHGGKVGVDARPTGGSAFWFEIPRA